MNSRFFLIRFFRWPWLAIATVSAMVLPWGVYAIAGYIAAAAEMHSAEYVLGWQTPSAGVWSQSAITIFIAVLLIGWAAEGFRARKRTGTTRTYPRSSTT